MSYLLSGVVGTSFALLSPATAFAATTSSSTGASSPANTVITTIKTVTLSCTGSTVNVPIPSGTTQISATVLGAGGGASYGGYSGGAGGSVKALFPILNSQTSLTAVVGCGGVSNTSGGGGGGGGLSGVFTGTPSQSTALVIAGGGGGGGSVDSYPSSSTLDGSAGGFSPVIPNAQYPGGGEGAGSGGGGEGAGSTGTGTSGTAFGAGGVSYSAGGYGGGGGGGYAGGGGGGGYTGGEGGGYAYDSGGEDFVGGGQGGYSYISPIGTPVANTTGGGGAGGSGSTNGANGSVGISFQVTSLEPISYSSYSCTSSIVSVSTPSGTTAVSAGALGAGGGAGESQTGIGGNGGLVQAFIPVPQTSLEVLAGCGGQSYPTDPSASLSGGGGGLSGVFTGTPSQSTALIVAGGGGGAGGDNTTPNGYPMSGSSGGISPSNPNSSSSGGVNSGGAGGPGLGGVGTWQESGFYGTAFGAGGYGYCPINSSDAPSGGYGGGGSGGCGSSYPSGGGGGGYTGGEGGESTATGGQGGYSYVASSASDPVAITGGGAPAGITQPGGNGSVGIVFYKNNPNAQATPIQTVNLSCTGQVANVTVPVNTTSMTATVSGAGGAGGQVANTYGGNGGYVKASVPISNSQTSLDALVGCGAPTIWGAGGGGGLSGIFTGTPSQSTALIVAGGGGGGANDNTENTQSNGTAGGMNPTLPFSPSNGNQGGAGYGGGGASVVNSSGNNGSAFGAGGTSTGNNSGAGGFGGGASGGNGWGGGGGAGGYVGGQGGESTYNFFPAGSFPNGLWESTPGNCNDYDPSQAVLSASIQQNAYNGMPAMVLSGSYGNACETHPITMPPQLTGGNTFTVRFAAQTQGPLYAGPNFCIWDTQANECLPASWSPYPSNVSNWTVFNVTVTLPASYVNGNNLTMFLYSGGTSGGPAAVNAYADVQMLSNNPIGSGGQGGSSYVTSAATNVTATTGGGAKGGFGSAGANGSITIQFFGKSGPPNIPIFSGSTTNLEPGWALQQPTANYEAGYGSSPAGDGGWSNVQTNGSAIYTFTIPSGQSSTITYGTPIDGYVNGSPSSIYINGALQATITADTGSGLAPYQEDLWSHVFTAGTYTLKITSASNINVYGLWASNTSVIIPVASGPPNIPIFSGSTTNLEPGWSLQKPSANYPAGYGSSPTGDGGWSNVQTNGSASYTFSIPSGQSSTISYGIPINGYVNNSQTKIYINDILQTTITADIGSGTAASQENLWSNTFQPGTYTIRIVSTGSINVYGLWASNLSYVTPQNPSPTQKITLSCTGQVANVSIPSGTTSIVASVSGAGGAGGLNDSTYGGAGGFVQAAFPITSGQTSLDAIVGCGGQTDEGSGGGGGLSGIFTGTPSQSTALIVAGGGGGGANAFSTSPKTNGSAGGFSPTLPFSPSGGTQGGAGYGGAGAGIATGVSGTAFGAGGNSSSASWCYYSGVGGFGGGGAGGCGNGGGGGGGGFIGGQGGNTGGPGGTWGNGSGGQGGTSYTASSASNVKSTTGGGGQGGFGGAAGGNGSITITFNTGTAVTAPIGTQTTSSCTNTPQTISVPSGTSYIVATLYGAGGAGGQRYGTTTGGDGAMVEASVPIPQGTSTLTEIVGCGGWNQYQSYGTSGGGGGLTGIFAGTPSQSTALIVAGGGGGGADTTASTSSANGIDGGFSPAAPSSTGTQGGPGYGGAGAPGGSSGTAFGAGATPDSNNCWYLSAGAGGFGGGGGGGASGCSTGGGGGGGGGYVGGAGGASGYGGGGGSSYVTSSGTILDSATGGGSPGGYRGHGSPGFVTLSFYQSGSIHIVAPPLQGFSSYPNGYFLLNQPIEFNVTPGQGTATYFTSQYGSQNPHGQWVLGHWDTYQYTAVGHYWVSTGSGNGYWQKYYYTATNTSWVPTQYISAGSGTSAGTPISGHLAGVQPAIQDVSANSPYYGQTYDGPFCSGGTTPLISPSSASFPDYSGQPWKYTSFFAGQNICSFDPTSIPNNNIQAWKLNNDKARIILTPVYQFTVNGQIRYYDGTPYNGPVWALDNISSVTCAVQNSSTYCPGVQNPVTVPTS
ncbi:MAG: beta strand repeat-containing protein [Ferrimicrobium acidiphilum]